MVREKLTGEKPPASVAHAVDLWRPFIEEKAGGDLEKLASALRDQKSFARLTRTLLNHLAFGDQNESDQSGEDAEGESADGENDQGEDQDAQQDGESAATESAGRRRGRRGSRFRNGGGAFRRPVGRHRAGRRRQAPAP